MPLEGAFHFRGHYRVQSSSDAEPSTLAGSWEVPRPGVLSCEELQHCLASSGRWQGRASVALAIARVEQRSGAFESEPDALYYEHSFRPAPGTPALATHVLDVEKLMQLWSRRLPRLADVFDAESLQVLLDALGADPRSAAANEYLCHEAGHATGFDVDAKYASGYFRLGSARGGISWPLVFMEEFRADLLSFHYAAQLLPPGAREAVFAYQLLHRAGLAAEASCGTGPHAGAVPYLLIDLLRQLGFLCQDGAGRLSLRRSGPGLREALELCAQHADLCLESPQGNPRDPLDEALTAARYFRARVSDPQAQAAYQAVFPAATGAGSR